MFSKAYNKNICKLMSHISKVALEMPGRDRIYYLSAGSMVRVKKNGAEEK